MQNEESEERVSIFIDGSNLYHSLKNLSTDIDFKRLITLLLRNRKLVNVYYYIAPLDLNYNPEKYWKHQKFLNSLK